MDPIRLLDCRLTVVSTAVYTFSVPMDKPYILYQKDKHWPFAGVICGVQSLHNIKSCLTVCYSPFDFYKSPEKNYEKSSFQTNIFFRCILIYDIYELLFIINKKVTH